MKSKVIVALLFAVMAFSPRVFAFGDTTLTSNSSAVDNAKNTNTSVNTNVNNANANSHSDSNASVNHSGNSSSNSSVNHSGNSNVRNNVSNKQAQGQIQGQKQSNSGTNTTNDSSGSNNKAYAVAYPSVNGTVGNSTGNAGSIFGNLTISNTEKYKQIQEIIQTINAEMSAGAIDKATGQVIVDALNTKLLGTVKTQRVLGILWETSGKNLSNLMGFLTWDSYWKDGRAQGGKLDAVTIALDTTETNKTVTGETVPTTK